MILVHVFACGSIFPYQNDIPVDKNGVRHEAVCYGWLIAMALLRNPVYRLECEEILWSTNLVVFNGYTIRRFFSTLDELRGRGHQAEVLTTLRKGWIKRVSLHFSNADRDYTYAITERNPVEMAGCDGINFREVVNNASQKRYYAAVRTVWRLTHDNGEICTEEGLMSDALDLAEHQLNDLGIRGLPYYDPIWFSKQRHWRFCHTQLIEMITPWMLQARRLAEMRQLDYLEVDVENARLLGRWNCHRKFDAILIGVCGKLVRDFGNAKRVVCCGASTEIEATLFDRCYAFGGQDEEQNWRNNIEHVKTRDSTVRIALEVLKDFGYGQPSCPKLAAPELILHEIRLASLARDGSSY